jgi:hypothetical protein
MWTFKGPWTFLNLSLDLTSTGPAPACNAAMYGARVSLALEEPWTYLHIACYLISEDPLHMAAVCDTLLDL